MKKTILPLLLLFSCAGTAANKNTSHIKINGIAEYLYINRHWPGYTPISEKYIAKNGEWLFFEGFYSVEPGARQLCGHRHAYTAKKHMGRHSITLNAHYRDTAISKSAFPTHHGGDIYHRGSLDTLVVAFQIKGKGVLVKPGCPGYENYLSNNKMYEQAPEYHNFPFVKLMHYRKVKALTTKQMRGRGLKKSGTNSFDVFMPWESDDIK